MDEEQRVKLVDNGKGVKTFYFPQPISLVQEGERVIPMYPEARWADDVAAWQAAGKDYADAVTIEKWGANTIPAIDSGLYYPLAQDIDMSKMPQIVGYELMSRAPRAGANGYMNQGAFIIQYPGQERTVKIPLRRSTNMNLNHGAGYSKFLWDFNKALSNYSFDLKLLDDVNYRTQLVGEFMGHYPGGAIGFELLPKEQRKAQHPRFDQHKVGAQFNWVTNTTDGIGKYHDKSVYDYEKDISYADAFKGLGNNGQYHAGVDLTGKTRINKKGGKMKLIPRRQRGGLIQKAQEGIPGGFRPWMAYGEDPYSALYRAQNDPIFKRFADAQYDGGSTGILKYATLDENGEPTIRTETLSDVKVRPEGAKEKEIATEGALTAATFIPGAAIGRAAGAVGKAINMAGKAVTNGARLARAKTIKNIADMTYNPLYSSYPARQAYQNTMRARRFYQGTGPNVSIPPSDPSGFHYIIRNGERIKIPSNYAAEVEAAMVEGRLPAGAESWADAEGILNTFEHTGRPLRNLTWADYANYRKMTEYARHRDKIARAFDNRLRLGAVAIPIVGAGYGASQYFDDDVIESSVDSVPYVHPDYRPQSLTPGDTVEVDPSMISDSDLIRR